MGAPVNSVRPELVEGLSLSLAWFEERTGLRLAQPERFLVTRPVQARDERFLVTRPVQAQDERSLVV